MNHVDNFIQRIQFIRLMVLVEEQHIISGYLQQIQITFGHLMLLALEDRQQPHLQELHHRHQLD